MAKAKRVEPEVPTMTEIPLSLIETWISQSVPCDYVQFRTKPIPTKKRNEPVWEMKTDTEDARYKVDAIHYNLEVLIFEAYGEKHLVPAENVAHAHPIVL